MTLSTSFLEKELRFNGYRHGDMENVARDCYCIFRRLSGVFDVRHAFSSGSDVAEAKKIVENHLCLDHFAQKVSPELKSDNCWKRLEGLVSF